MSVTHLWGRLWFHLSFLIFVAFPLINRGDIKQMTFCEQKSSRRLLFVSTLDGKISALDANNRGKIEWTLDFNEGPMLSSSIHRRELNNNGQWVRLIPSLNGGLFKFDGENLEAVSISASQLLHSSFQYSDGLVFSGGREVKSYGVSSTTGKILYECGINGCTNNTNGESHIEQDILIVQRFQQTVRAVEPRTGVEKWNFSVGQHDVVLSPHADAYCEDKDNIHIMDTEIKVVVPDGLIWAVNKNNPAAKLWQYKFDSPIVTIWREDGNKKLGGHGNLKEISLFDSTQWSWSTEFSFSPGNAFYLYDNDDDDDTPVQIIIVSLWYWWKEVLIISITTAILLNFILRQRLPNTTTVAKDAVLPPLTVERHIETTKRNQLTNSENEIDSFKSRYLTDFEPGDCLGRGGYGVVFEAKKIIDDRHYAIKRIGFPNRISSRVLLREVRALAILDHQNIIRYFDAWLECPPAGWQAKHDRQWNNSEKERQRSFSSDLNSKPRMRKSPKMVLYIQIELCQRLSLREWLKNQTVRDYRRVLNVFQQIVEAVEHVHLKGFIHRDLKPSNILFSFDDKIKVAGFGPLTAMREDYDEAHTPPTVKEGVTLNSRLHTAYVGTHLYKPPEQINGQGYNYKVDIYSLGIILFELLTPFVTEMERIVALGNLRKLIFSKDFSNDYPDEFDLLKMMLDENPNSRPSTLGIKTRAPLLNYQTTYLYCDERRHS